MFALLSYLIALIGITAAFFSPKWAWIPLLLLDAWIIITWRTLRRRMRFAPVAELSPVANRLLEKYGHFYAKPWAGSSFSSATSTMVLAGAAIGVVSLVKGYWLGIGFAVAHYFVMGFIGWQFNPTRVLINDDERAAHDQLLDYFNRRGGRSGTP